jgi:hypothetical protein
MTWKEWFIHFASWLHTFPKKHIDEHLWVSVAGEKDHTCMICDGYGVEEETTVMTRKEKPVRRADKAKPRKAKR